MCYNSAHPDTWKKVFNINNEKDIENIITYTYDNNYNGIPGSNGWFIDQEIMYKYLINYPYLHIMNRPIKRLETWTYMNHLNNGDKNFIKEYDDCHFHRSYNKNINMILDAENQL